MLTQQGLAEISHAMQSEQIAYLLMERARLLHEVDEHKNDGNHDAANSAGSQPEAELKSILERERKEFEEELNQQRDNARMMSEQLKHEHEEEITSFMDENSKLEEDLQRAEMMVSQLKAELSKYTEGDNMAASLNQSLKVSSEEERRQLSKERSELDKQREELEKDMEEIEKDRADFQAERDQFDQEMVVFELKKSNLDREKTMLEHLKRQIEDERHEIEQARAALQRENQVVTQRLVDREEMKTADLTLEKESSTEKEATEKEGLRRRGSLSRTPSDLTLRKIIEDKTKVESEVIQLKAQLRALQKENDSHDSVVAKLNEELEKSVTLQQQLQIKNRSLKKELQELEDQLDEAEAKLDSTATEKQNLSEKFETLNSEVKTLRTDAMKSYTLQDIVDILNNDKKQLSQSLESLKSKMEQAESEKNELANENKSLSKGEQDLTNQLRVCKQELERMAAEKGRLESEKHDLQLMIKKQEEVEKMLKADLEDADKAKEKYALQVENFSKENKDLLNKLDRAKEELEKAKLQLQELAKQELVIKHLKEQNQQLHGQVNISREELEKSRDRETMLISTQEALQRSHDGTEKRYICEIDDLKVKLELTLQELTKTKYKVEELNSEKISLAESVKRMEQLVQESEKIKEALKEETVRNDHLKSEASQLQVELTQKSLMADQSDLQRKQCMLDLEARTEVIQSLEETIKSLTSEAEHEREQRQIIEKCKDELEKTLAVQVSHAELTAAQEVADEQREHCQVLELKVVQLEQSVKDAETSRDSAVEELEAERKLRLNMELTVQDLQMQLANQVTTEKDAELIEELNEKVAALDESKEVVRLLTEKLENEKNLRTELAEKVADLGKAQDEDIIQALKAARSDLEQERRATAECNVRLQEIEQLLDDQKVDSESLHHSLGEKILSLEKQVQALQDDLFNAQDELQAFQEKYDKAVKEAEVTRVEIMEKNMQGDTLYTPVPLSHQSEDQGSSLLSVSVKLQEKLNELNTLKSKLYQLQEQLDCSSAEASSYRQESVSLKQSLEMATKQLELSEDRIRTMRHELAEAQGTLQFTQNQLKEKQLKLDSVIQDRDQIRRELETVHEKLLKSVAKRSSDAGIYGENERLKHIDKVSMLEKLSQQFELDNREMSKKLADAMRKCETLEDQLQKEKLRSAEKYQQRNRYTSQLEKDIETASSHIRNLREELQKHQAKTYRLEADNLGLTAKYQSTIARLEQEIKDVKHRSGQELASMKERMNASSAEVTELRGLKRELEQELSRLRLDVSRLKLDNGRLEAHLQAECKQKVGLESRNCAIDSEISKMLSQVRSLMEKNTELESANRSLEQELSLGKSTLRRMETNVVQKEAVLESSAKTILTRAELSERKARDLQKQLEEVTNKMLNVEKQLAQADLGSVQLQDTRDTLLAVRHQLEGEKLQRSILDQTVAELKHQVALLKQSESAVRTENKELQHTILDLESHLNVLQDKSDRNLNVHKHIPDVGQDSLLDQVNRLQIEVKHLQQELSNMSERRDADMHRYEERKLRTKAKLMKARTLYTAERSRYMEQMKNMEEDLRLTQASLNKETEWGKKMDQSHKLLLREKRDLITHYPYDAFQTFRVGGSFERPGTDFVYGTSKSGLLRRRELSPTEPIAGYHRRETTFE
ncbi:hypothetical protein BsWGS_26965 [Bradybaena similaris]